MQSLVCVAYVGQRHANHWRKSTFEPKNRFLTKEIGPYGDVA